MALFVLLHLMSSYEEASEIERSLGRLVGRPLTHRMEEGLC